MGGKNLNTKKIITGLLVTAGIVTLVLPWRKMIMLSMTVTGIGMSIGSIMLACYMAIGLLIITGQPGKALRIKWLIAILLSLGIIGMLVLVMTHLDSNEVVILPGYWLAIAAAIALFIFLVVAALPGKKPVRPKTDTDAMFASFVLAKSGKMELLQPILDRCKKDNISVYKHFEEGLVRRYQYSAADARLKMNEWIAEFKEDAAKDAPAIAAAAEDKRTGADFKDILLILFVAGLVFLLMIFVVKIFR